MECSRRPLSPSGRSTGAWSRRAAAPSTPAPLACCLRTGGLAPPARCPHPWPETQQFPQEWITNKKTKQELFKKISSPPATVLSSIIFLTVYSSRIQSSKVSVTHVMNLLPISWKESCAILYTSLPFSSRVSFSLHFHIAQLSSIFGVEEGGKSILSAPKFAV